ncbi:MAG: hypothetical protein E6Q77_00210 [Rhizobium sp.]|nr:MAG: hypothetical protein E6Q77_00210 [Rhizobium sp.]
MTSVNSLPEIGILSEQFEGERRVALVPSDVKRISKRAATANVVGGFLITDRLLAMFKRGDADKKKGASSASAQ